MDEWVIYWREFVREKNPSTEKEPQIHNNDHVSIESTASYSELYGHPPVSWEDDPVYLKVNVTLKQESNKLSVKYSKQTKEGFSAFRKQEWEKVCKRFEQESGLKLQGTYCEGSCAAIFTI